MKWKVVGVGIVLFSIVVVVVYGVGEERDLNIQCKSKKIIDLKKKPSKSILTKTKLLFKKLDSINQSIRNKAFREITPFLPYLLFYLKKNYRSLSYWQKFYLRPYLKANIVNISYAEIVCYQKEKFLWYVVIDDRLIIIGNHRNIIDTHSAGDFGIIQINNASCDVLDGTFTKYAIEVKLGWGPPKMKMGMVGPANRGARRKVAVNGVFSNGKFYKDAYLVSSSNKQRFIIIQRDMQRRKSLVIMDDKIYWACTLIRDISFSSDNKHTAYRCRDAVPMTQNHRLVKEMLPIASIAVRSGTISVKRIGEEKFIEKDGWSIILDKEKQKQKYNEIDKLTFSPGISILVYVGRVDNTLILHTGNETKKLPYSGIKDIIFSEDGKRIAYIAKKEDRYVVNVDGKEDDNVYKDIHCFTFSRDGKRYMYVGKEDSKKEVLVIDGKESAKFFSANNCPVFASNDGNKITYVMVKKPGDIKNYVIENGVKKFSINGTIEEIVYSADGSSFGAIVRRQHKTNVLRGYKIIINGKMCKENYNGIGIYGYYERFPGKLKIPVLVVFEEYWPKSLIFSPDGRKLAYLFQKNVNGPWQVMLREGKFKKVSAKYFDIFPTDIAFSPDSKFMVFVGVNSDATARVNINNVPVVTYLNHSLNYYMHESSVIFLGYRQGSVYKVVCK